MKLIITIIKDSSQDVLTNELTAGNFRVTHIASTGGFFRKGYTTLLIGVEDERVDAALDVIRKSCPPATEPGEKRATIFILNVNQFYQI